MPIHNYRDLIQLFESCFNSKFNTRLVKGQHEPIYIPSGVIADGYALQNYHQIIFAHGFFRSALHEISHWLVAGESRRRQLDYGYWYETDGRNAKQQLEFERVEVKPQAVEWILTKACNHNFRVSIDNLNGEATDDQLFKKAVFRRVTELKIKGISDRTEAFRQALALFYGTEPVFERMEFNLSEL